MDAAGAELKNGGTLILPIIFFMQSLRTAVKDFLADIVRVIPISIFKRD